MRQVTAYASARLLIPGPNAAPHLLQAGGHLRAWLLGIEGYAAYMIPAMAPHKKYDEELMMRN
eukprot:6483848-Amphidinium_carterae.1